MICLDTSAYSNLKRGHREISRVVARATRIVVPTIVLGELRYGFALGSQTVKNETELAEFLATPLVEVADVVERTSSRFAEIMVDLRTAGTPVPTNDVWIAALAVQTGTTVVTFDQHFQRIAAVNSIIL